MEYKYIFFDLDGTLTDPVTGITKSVKHALDYFNIDANLADLTKFIGPPLRDSIKKYYKFDDADTEKAVEKYREYFSDKGIYENELYDGIDDLLASVKAEGAVIVLATSKVMPHAVEILKHFGIFDYFDFISGSELDGTRSKKEEVVRYALENLSINDLDKVIMVGDTEYDIIGAKANNIKSAGLLYGYGSRDALAAAGADFIIDDVGGLKRFLLK